MAATLGRRNRVDLVDDEPADRSQDLACRACQQQEQRLRRRDQDVWRVALHRTPRVGRRIASADGDRDVGRLKAVRLHLVPDPDERRTKVAVDVMRKCLQRRYIKDATALCLDRGRFRRQSVEAPEKGGECLAAARRRRHEDVAACRHFLPAPLLDRCWFGERRAKPVANGRREEIESIENLPHITQFDDFRDYKQVFLTGLIQTSDECIRASDSRPRRSALDPDRAGDGRRAT